MSEEEIKKIVFKLLKTIAPDTEPETLNPDDNIRKVLNIDSYDYLQFIVGLDKNFGIETPEADYGKIQEFDKLIRYILSRTK